MAVRQYIGARYVPKFSDKNGGVWDNTYTYEAFEIVRYGNDYYTAKNPVPTGVAISDTNYWVQTGNYNGAISMLQGEIDNINNITIPDLHDDLEGAITNKTGALYNYYNSKKIHFFGDSYAEGAICISTNPNQYSRNYSDGWMSKLINLLEMDSDHAIAHPTGGASFALSGGSHWQDVISGMSEDDDVDMVVVAGGANDFPASYANIISGINTFCNAVKSKFPNATIVLGMIGFSRWASSPVPCEKTYRAYRDGIISNGGIYMSGIENISHIAEFFSLDNLHLNADGYTAIAQQMANIMKSGCCDFEKQTVPTLTLSITGTLNVFHASELLYNNLEIMNIRVINIGAISGFSLSLNPNYFVKIGTLSNNNMIGREDYGIYGECLLILTVGGNYKSYKGWVKIVGSDLLITGDGLVGNTFETVSPTSIQIFNLRLISTTLDTM